MADIDYYLQRAEQEAVRAIQADHPKAAAAHSGLTVRYSACAVVIAIVTSRTRPRIESGIASLLRRFEPASHAVAEPVQIAQFATEARNVGPCPIRDTARHDRAYGFVIVGGHPSRAGIRPQPSPGRIA